VAVAILVVVADVDTEALCNGALAAILQKASVMRIDRRRVSPFTLATKLNSLAAGQAFGLALMLSCPISGFDVANAQISACPGNAATGGTPTMCLGQLHRVRPWLVR